MRDRKACIKAVEECVDDVANSFQRLAFNFHTKGALQAYLFGRLRAKKLHVPSPNGNVELVHAEFPVLWENGLVKGHYDIVVWEPKNAARYPHYWGESHSDQARHIPVLIAIEIKHLYGKTEKMKPLSSYSRIMKHGDIRKLTKGQNQCGYFLAFSDEDIAKDEQFKVSFEKMGKGFERATNRAGSKLRALCISRDGYKFRLNFLSE